MSSRFYFGSPGSSDNEGSEYDDDSLPFPKPLARSSFHTPDFDAAAFLAGLTARFQTLEDLQAELKSLSTTIQTELVDLVNENYEEFLSLGTSLSGGEERIEEVRVGLMGVEREMTALRVKVEEERERVKVAMEAKKEVVKESRVGRGLLEIDRRVEELERRLGISEARPKSPVKSAEAGVDGHTEWGEEWKEDSAAFLESSDDEEEEESTEEGKAPQRLNKKVEQWLCIKYLINKHDPYHPFIVAEQPRLRKIKDTLLLDIDASIRAQADVKGKQNLLGVRREVES